MAMVIEVDDEVIEAVEREEAMAMVIEVDDEVIDAARTAARRIATPDAVATLLRLAWHVLERARWVPRDDGAHGTGGDGAPPSLLAMDSDRGLVG